MFIHFSNILQFLFHICVLPSQVPSFCVLPSKVPPADIWLRPVRPADRSVPAAPRAQSKTAKVYVAPEEDMAVVGEVINVETLGG